MKKLDKGKFTNFHTCVSTSVVSIGGGGIGGGGHPQWEGDGEINGYIEEK